MARLQRACKSMLLGQLAVSFAAQNYRTVVASFEMAPHRTLLRTCTQASGTGDPSDQFVISFCDWLRVWFYNHQGQVEPKHLYGLARYGGHTLGIDQLIIGPLIKVMRGSDDYNAQKDFIADLTTLARDLEMHIHVVHHARKGSDESEPPRKLDARGAGEITDQVDNVVTIWANKQKSQDRANGKIVKQDPDLLLVCDKQRNGPWEGVIKLWFHEQSLQFLSDPEDEPQDSEEQHSTSSMFHLAPHLARGRHPQHSALIT